MAECHREAGIFTLGTQTEYAECGKGRANETGSFWEMQLKSVDGVGMFKVNYILDPGILAA